VACGTWAVSYWLFVEPRNYEISRLKDQLSAAEKVQKVQFQPSPIVLPEIGVNSGNAVTTSDGICTVRVISTSGAEVSLRVTVGVAEVQYFKAIKTGERVVVHGENSIYYIDILRARGDIVDLTISKHSDA
jgi:hypothetical protein